MGWIAAAIVYVAFLFKFPKATVITTLVLVGLAVVLIGGSMAWSAHLENVKKNLRRSVSVDVVVSTENCGTEMPINVTYRNNSDKTLIEVRGELAEPGLPPSLQQKQQFSLPRKVPPRSSISWCYPIKTEFLSERPLLDLSNGDRPEVTISEYSITFE